MKSPLELPYTVTAEDRKVLRRIRDLVEKTHWTRGQYHTQRKGKDLYCLVGMVEKETGTEVTRSLTVLDGGLTLTHAEAEAYRRSARLKTHLLKTIQRLYPRGNYWTVEGWNDKPNRNRDQVIKVIDEALKAK